MKKSKIKIAMDLVVDGQGGGPHTSTVRMMESSLNLRFEFIPIHYDRKHGSGISFKRILDLKKQIQEAKPDIVHFTGLQLSGFHMILACLLSGKKNTIVSVRGFSGDDLYLSKIKKIIMSYIIEPITLILAKKVVCVSNYVRTRKIIKLIANHKSSYIYNFPPTLCNKKTKVDYREKYNIANDEIILVSVARIVKDKGYEYLTDAILKIDPKLKIRIFIVGDGSYLDEMKSQLSIQRNTNKVIFMGYQKEIEAILTSSDIFILPTLHETLSVALLEASAVGLALLGSNVGGVPEIIEENKNGFLFEPANSDEIVEKILTLYENKNLISSFGLNAQKKINDKFNHQRIVKQWTDVYDGILGIK